MRRVMTLLLATVTACGSGDDPTPPTVKEVTASASATTLVVGATAQLSAQVIGTDGAPVHGVQVKWTSLTPTIVGVSTSGVATALAAGAGKVRASFGGRSGDVDLTVTNPPVASITFDRDSALLTLPSGSVTPVLVAKDAAGKAISNPTFFFATDAPKVATVTQLGVITAVAAGTARISASTDGVTATLPVRVTTNVTATSPRITSVTPLVAGGSAVVTGSNFAAAVSGNAVLVEGVAATVTAASSTQLSITLPATGWACDVPRPVSVQVNANGESGVGTATLRTALPRTLAVGQSVVLSAASDARCNELSATGGEYLVSVYNAARTLTGNDATFALRGAAGAGAASAAALQASAARRVERTVSSALTAAAPRPAMPRVGTAGFARELDVAQEARTRRAHADVLQRSITFARQQGSPAAVLRRLRALNEDEARPATARASQIATVGAITPLKLPNLDAQNFCTSNIPVGVRTAWVGQKAIIVEDTTSVLNGVPTLRGQLDSLYAQVGQEFDTVMWPILTTNFGNPLAMDRLLSQTGKVVMLFSPRVNGLLGGALTGFVASCDFFPVSQAPSSNFGEFFYAIMPTSLAPGLAKGTRDSWLREVRGTIVHEVKHITSFGERFSRNADFEELWLEEGLARHAEEQMARVIHNVGWKANTGYQQSVFCEVRPATSSAPQCAGRPILMLRHFDAMYQYLQAPDLYSMLGRTTPADATFYGTSWSIVRWMMDQYATSEATFLSALVQSTRSGVANLESRVSGHVWEEMLGEWTLALFADDYPGVTFANTRLQFPSWNMRDEFLGLCTDFGLCGTLGNLSNVYPVAYPFAPRATPFGAFNTSVAALPAGSFTSWYLSGTQAAPQLLDLRGANGGEPPGQLRVAILRVK